MSTITKERDSLRTVLTEKKALLDQIESNALKDETGNGHYVISTEAAGEFRKVLAECKDIRARLSDLGEYEEIDAYLNNPGAESKAAQIPMQRGMLERKSIGQRFTESAE